MLRIWLRHAWVYLSGRVAWPHLLEASQMGGDHVTSGNAADAGAGEALDRLAALLGSS